MIVFQCHGPIGKTMANIKHDARKNKERLSKKEAGACAMQATSSEHDGVSQCQQKSGRCASRHGCEATKARVSWQCAALYSLPL